MKKVNSSIVILCTAVVFGACFRANAQQNEGAMFQMIKVSLPDSVVFTLAKDKTTAGISVYLVSGQQSVEGDTYSSGVMSLRNDKMYMTSQTRLTTKNFKLPAGFQAKKIKF